VNSATVDKDQSDPSIYCVLTARSKMPGVSLADFLIFTPKWSVTSNTFRPPYYHRNVNTEIMGMFYGDWYGTGHSLAPGGLSYEVSFMPHGGESSTSPLDLFHYCILSRNIESIEKWREATTAELIPQRSANMIGMIPAPHSPIVNLRALSFHVPHHRARRNNRICTECVKSPQ
jgi:homogentisate 1,2-dioxygenase